MMILSAANIFEMFSSQDNSIIREAILIELGNIFR